MDIGDVQSERYRGIIANTFAADHALDADRFVESLAPDVVFQIGAMPPVQGRDATRRFVRQLFVGLTEITHRLRQVYEQSDTLIYEADVTYRFHDGRQVALPYANVLHVAGDLIDRYRIYLDLSAMHP